MRGLLAGLALLAATAAAAQERPVIAAVNYPLAYFAERLAGDAVDVLYPVPAGRDPSFWSPGIADIAAIQEADLIALNGAGFAQWTTKVSLPRSRIVDTSAGVADAYIATETVTHSHGADGAHSHAGTASYTWLDFGLAAEQARALASAMERRVPATADGLADRLEALIADLEALDMRATEVGAALAGTAIIATHPRYQYFARAYGLDIASLEWEAGTMPSEEQWADLARLAEETGATLLIWEAAPPPEAAARLAELGLDAAVLPPLAAPPDDGAGFVEAMRAGLDSLAAAAG